MTAGEVRQNAVLGRWVIYAPGRGQRPVQAMGATSSGDAPQELPGYDSSCPFCPGNESMLPGILAENPGIHGGVWGTRVVPNKFPAVNPAASAQRISCGPYMKLGNQGSHEVIIETPEHHRELPDQERAQMRLILETYHQRYKAFDLAGGYRSVILFRNHGPRAGTSLLHPHSQLIALPFIPERVRQREHQADEYFQRWGRCMLCDMLEFELSETGRIIETSAEFVSLVPYFAEVPFESWVVPRRHRPDFSGATPDELGALGESLPRTLRRLRRVADDPDYNYVFHGALHRPEDDPSLHWFVQIRPRLVERAGFELGSGLRINTSMPEADAEALRQAADGGPQGNKTGAYP